MEKYVKQRQNSAVQQKEVMCEKNQGLQHREGGRVK